MADINFKKYSNTSVSPAKELFDILFGNASHSDQKPKKKKTEEFIINPESKAITYIPANDDDPAVVKTHPDDEFDKYVGAALAYAYSKFGSRTQFRKFVDKHSKEIQSREARKASNKHKGE